MKKIILLITVITLLNTFANSQVDTSASKPNNENAVNPYLQKAKKQKTAAWIMLGGGALLTSIGIATFPKGYDILFDTNTSSEDAKANTATGLVVIGGLSMLGSIPIFIAAGRNKFRARLSLANQKTAFQLPGKINKNMPGISLSIPIGR